MTYGALGSRRSQKVGADFSCNLCESKFSSLKGLIIHEIKKHNLTNSPIPQVDGVHDEEVLYTFVSDFHQEDIEYTLKEFIPDVVETKLVSVTRIGGLQSADQLCQLILKIPPNQKFNWPMMNRSQADVIWNEIGSPYWS